MYKIIKVIVLFVFFCVTGCAKDYVIIDSFCLWARPHYITKDEKMHMSKETLNWFTDINEQYQKECQSK